MPTSHAPPSPLAGEGVVPKGRRMRGAPQGALPDATLADGLFRQRRANFCHCEFRRTDHEIIRQPQGAKSLRCEPSIPANIALHASLGLMTRPINLEHESVFEADEVDDEVSQHHLALKLRAMAAPIAHRLPDQRLGRHRLRALFACELAHGRAGNFFGHWTRLCRVRSSAQRRDRAPDGAPLIRHASRDTFPREGGRIARGHLADTQTS